MGGIGPISNSEPRHAVLQPQTANRKPLTANLNHPVVAAVDGDLSAGGGTEGVAA
jgi:hypothetical protein